MWGGINDMFSFSAPISKGHSTFMPRTNQKYKKGKKMQPVSSNDETGCCSPQNK
jgi:hypothetical protein